MKHKLQHFFTKSLLVFRNIYVIGGIGLIIIAVAVYVKTSSSNQEETLSPKIGLLTQSVKVTGPVTPTSEAMLSFEKSGAVSSVNVEVGNKVYAGQILATLSSADAYASLLQAQAALANQQATLEQLQAGARPEELAIKIQALDNAKSNLQVTYSAIPDSIRDADAKMSDAIKNKIASFFTYDGSVFRLTTAGCSQQFASNIEARRGTFEKTLADFQKKTASVSSLSDETVLDEGLNAAYITTREATLLLDDMATLFTGTCFSNSTSLDANRAIVSTARTTIGTVFSDINIKRTALNTAKSTFSSASRDLDLLKAGSDKTKIRAQAALVSQAEAQVASAQANLSKNTLVAPFNGVITKVNITKGEIGTAGKSSVTLISSSAFQVEAKIPEIDISKVIVGNPVQVTLDAYGESVLFDATVTRVDPSATMEGSVPVYKAIISFKEIDARIRAGMTANVRIITSSKEKALSLPIRFVTVQDDGTGLVQIKNGTTKKVTKVTLGIRGDDGSIEILSGLLPTDTVVAIQPGARASQKQN